MTSKYKNIKTDGYSSKKEAKRAGELKLLERAGHISGLREQVVYVLAPSVVIGGRKRPELRYIADFVYCKKKPDEIRIVDGIQQKIEWVEKTIVEDTKGVRTPAYRIKRHLMKSVHNIDILET